MTAAATAATAAFKFVLVSKDNMEIWWPGFVFEDFENFDETASHVFAEITAKQHWYNFLDAVKDIGGKVQECYSSQVAFLITDKDDAPLIPSMVVVPVTLTEDEFYSDRVKRLTHARSYPGWLTACARAHDLAETVQEAQSRDFRLVSRVVSLDDDHDGDKIPQPSEAGVVVSGTHPKVGPSCAKRECPDEVGSNRKKGKPTGLKMEYTHIRSIPTSCDPVWVVATDSDMLFQLNPGKKYFKFDGNVDYRNTIKEFYPKYKTAVAVKDKNNLLAEVKATFESGGGRFLKEISLDDPLRLEVDLPSNAFYLMAEEEVIERIRVAYFRPLFWLQSK